MLSKSQISLLNSLQHKKFRREHGLFIVEGYKSIIEFAHSGYHVNTIYHTTDATPKLLNLSQKINYQEITLTELQKISALKTPADALATINIPQQTDVDPQRLKNKFSLVLDGVQDPGNMGTIIRTADWFGFTDIICSEDTVDVYNPKVVQATMGSLARVNVRYVNLVEFIKALKMPVLGTLLNGENIYTTQLGHEGLLVLGNEGNGIRPDIQTLITKAVTIPRVGKAESLNVAVAAAVCCSQLVAKTYK
ncbi:TrmH family RNA methyltransferase [Mucilaginibacter sp.]|uniref:TrmH family RNA methyltransferase n=1 Tax=Mucilaginibacter sp. TaxID=1882438 RepID=UPI000CB08721|nr:RNA methyltransferase [Mucilaginibacter sp.]PLW88408.1 MAG: RNA methyltransferase [Mucilaginibacter sp.]HEK19178.1 RNA methyltransferase [Bacteroidota bacterium]